MPFIMPPLPKGRPSYLSELDCNYVCEWDSCEKSFSDTKNLKEHILDHFKGLHKSCCEEVDSPDCKICSITLDLYDWGLWERHSHFHAWAIELRTKGLLLEQKNGWPPCLLGTATRNTIPDLPTPFECCWEYCNYRTNDIADFATHASRHSAEYTDSRYSSDVALRCLWENCGYVAKHLKNLAAHLQAHVQSKRIACHTCGLLFVLPSKLEEHLKRQQIHVINNSSSETHHPSIKPVRCPRCRRLFATEKYLINHMRRHVNTVKCPYCDMTTADKTALRRHLLFRHNTERPFVCGQCEYRCKTASTLKRHIQMRHCESPPEYTLAEESRTAPVRGPLAAAGVLSSFAQPTEDPIMSTFSINTNTSLRPKALVVKPSGKRWIRCNFDGCRFKSTTEKGYCIHMGMKHPELIPGQISGERPRGKIYSCHLCNFLRLSGSQLSNHLIRVHNLTRPSGHARFTYTLCEDGYFRLLLTRLDTVPVAKAVLGENMVTTLLSSAEPTIN